MATMTTQPVLGRRPDDGDDSDFQCVCGPLTLCGDIKCVLISDCCPPGDIIRMGEKFDVRVSWDITGTVVPLMGGSFDVHVSLEGVGRNAPEVDLPPVTVPITDGIYASGPPARRDFTKDINVNTGSYGLKTGVYLLSIYLTYTDATGSPGPIAGMSPEHFIQLMP